MSVISSIMLYKLLFTIYSSPLISQRLARLQCMRDPLLSFALAAQTQKRLALQIKQVLFGNKTLMIQISATQDFRQFYADYFVVVRDVAAALHHMQTQFQSCKPRFAER